MKKIFWIIALCATVTAVACSSAKKNTAESKGDFVTVRDGKFYIGDSVYRFVGTNFWYGPILASEGRGGDRKRLARELDLLQENGINNLRILVGGDGDEGLASHISPVLQTAPGVYNDTLLAGLDYLMTELERRDMKAVLYLNNAWEWSGGYSAYLQWAGKGKAPIPSVDGWPAYMDYVRQFVTCDSAKQLSYNHVRNIVSRVNTVTGKPYAESPAIMAWQVANEPRAFAEDSLQKRAFADWIRTTARIIKENDPNHLVSTGSEGKHGCEQDIALWEEIHNYPEIDYGILHLWSYNWGWVGKETLLSGVDSACIKAVEYITPHSDMMKRARKPLVWRNSAIRVTRCRLLPVHLPKEGTNFMNMYSLSWRKATLSTAATSGDGADMPIPRMSCGSRATNMYVIPRRKSKVLTQFLQKITKL